MTWIHEHSWKLAAAPDRVYSALTDPAELTRWFAAEADIELIPGGRYRFWGKHTLGRPSRAEADQMVTRLEAGRSFGFTWRLYQTDTEVAIGLASEGAGETRLTLHHEVKGELPLPRPKELIDDHWRFAFGNLAAHLAGGAGIVFPDYADPAPAVRLTIEIAAAPEVVFKALIEPDSINRWFGSTSAVVDPRPGGRYQLSWKYRVDGRDVEGGPTKILEIIPNRKLVLDWPDWRGDSSVTGQTITFTLESTGTGTRVTFVHAGFGRTADMSDYPFGWVEFLGQLKNEAERP